MTLKFKFRSRFNPDMLSKPCKVAEHAVAIQAEKDTRPFVPRKTGALVNNAEVIQNMIVYHGPYARELYFGKQMVDPKTNVPGFPIGGGEFRSRRGIKKVKSTKEFTYTNGQSHWFDASKKKNVGKWAKIAQKEIAKNVNR